MELESPLTAEDTARSLTADLGHRWGVPNEVEDRIGAYIMSLEETIEKMRNSWVPGPQVVTREIAAANAERERIIGIFVRRGGYLKILNSRGNHDREFMRRALAPKPKRSR
jgi:hypothetical protein